MRPLRLAGRASRHALQNMRATVWQCLRCGTRHVKPTKAAAPSGSRPGVVQVDKRPNACQHCASPEIVKFDSRVEADYAAHLRMLQRVKVISGLAFHPVLSADVPPAAPAGVPCVVKYTADGTYLARDGTRVYYDVKAKGAPLEKDFSLRRRIVQAAHGLKIEIVRK